MQQLDSYSSLAQDYKVLQKYKNDLETINTRLKLKLDKKKSKI